jgi:hypothetical protein
LVNKTFRPISFLQTLQYNGESSVRVGGLDPTLEALEAREALETLEGGDLSAFSNIF